ncbi:hypothetical protein E2562_035907 [Oryza meyeriana var. granulata]|uniref:Uncharacterized protein n=1 Tax=Oryza meyeriana var. granulata TaxID=110450 RepID=A0A6G1E762_9ORYZ|nr:hypothetical protein E2562_035907 [Oryza meyeriana var. granulata]
MAVRFSGKGLMVGSSAVVGWSSGRTSKSPDECYPRSRRRAAACCWPATSFYCPPPLASPLLHSCTCAGLLGGSAIKLDM